jgi:hypothetical protein
MVGEDPMSRAKKEDEYRPESPEEVKSFDPTQEGSILQALDRIYEAGGKAWDNVDDVDGLLSEVRGA